MAALAVALAPARVAHAQIDPPSAVADPGQIHCSATSSTPIVRIEGTRELAGDIVVACHASGAASGAGRPEFLEVDIALSLNVDIASRTDLGQGPDVSDAILVVNDNNCNDEGALAGSGDCQPQGSRLQGPMRGRLDPSSRRTLRWSGVQLPFPGAPFDGVTPAVSCASELGTAGFCHPAVTTIRLTNLRVNSAQLGPSGEATGSVAGIEASLSLRAAGGAIRLENAFTRIAEAATGLTAEAPSLDADRLCSHGRTEAYVTVAEGFASSFKTAGTPSFRPGDPGWEEGFYPHSAEAAGPGQALRGTRLRIALARIPEGVSVIVPSRVFCSEETGMGDLELSLVSGSSPGGLGGSVARGQSTDRPLQVTSDRGATALYEVTRSSPLSREECRIPFQFSRPPRPEALFRGGEVEVLASLAPFGTHAADGQPDPETRFTGVRVSPRPSFQLAGCGTTLFFPFVTNQRNFDTAVVISNTSSDPLGTRHQSGRCLLQYHGAGLDEETDTATQQSGEIEAGGQLGFTLSSGSPAHGLLPLTGFQGYLVAECEFQHGHGFAFVTEQLNGTAVLAQGYLAQIVQGADQIGASGGLP